MDTLSGIRILHQGQFEEGTENVCAFLAIVHALAHLKKKNSDIAIYSDRGNAISWVQEKMIPGYSRPTDNNDKIFDLIDRAVKWLTENDFKNPVLKWERKAWGKIPADFGKK